MSRKSWRSVKEIRIADVARLAGVSTATVSRVLSDPDKVRQKTHDLVMEAVRRSGYTPNSTAQKLRTRRTMNVLVVAHGNSNRSIVMELDKLSPDQVIALELATGVPRIYEFDREMKAKLIS